LLIEDLTLKEKCIKILIGNKSDLLNKENKKLIIQNNEKFAKEVLKCDFIEFSALTGDFKDNIEKIFINLIEKKKRKKENKEKENQLSKRSSFFDILKKSPEISRKKSFEDIKEEKFEKKIMKKKSMSVIFIINCRKLKIINLKMIFFLKN
jgi:hypothetical protein